MKELKEKLEERKSWWGGDSRVEQFMPKVAETIKKYHDWPSDEFTDIYNRAYEAVYGALQFIEENTVSKDEATKQYLKGVNECEEKYVVPLRQQLEELKETATSRLTQMAADEISIEILSDQLAEAKAENSHLKESLQVTEVELEGANAYIGTIKAENEVLNKYYGQNENKTIPFLQQQIEQLKAENEKLGQEYVLAVDTWRVEVQKAKEDEKRRIFGGVMKIPLPANYYLGYRNCVLDAINADITSQQCKELKHKECKQTFEDCQEYWVWKRTYGKNAEQTKAITADQEVKV